ncbi:protein of unknown function [Vibrio tapetis subsp. tapetis]|uniref:Uncharacterized protein n=1 Tax=Vibrio tapetis subsp. tapetis TaxID=1671868 RepID=A0A2N8ZGW8_9VIBR|nr:protein of unknown function [Vibrio tapetis subsp. tapetis]
MVGEEPTLNKPNPRLSGFKRKKASSNDEAFLIVVGEEGFEPPTLWSQTRCATKLRYSPT